MNVLELKILLGASVKGQTFEDERAALGDWCDEKGDPVYFDPQEWKVPHWDAKLLGGQQIERMLFQFKAIASHLQLKDISVDDIATSAGLSGLKTLSSHVWAVRRNTFILNLGV